MSIPELRRPVRLLYRIGIGVTSQAVSSASNVAISLLGARYLTSEGFGAFATAYVIYMLVLGLTRGLVGEPVLVTRLDTSEVSGSVLGSTLMVAGVVSLVIVSASALFDQPLRSALVALAGVLPFVLLLDTARYLAFAGRRPQRALGLDVLWATAMLGAIGSLLLAHRLTPVGLILAWGGSASIGSALALTAGRHFRQSFRWLAENWHLSWRYCAEWAVSAGASSAALLILGPLAGLAALGAVRAAQVLFGPIFVLHAGTLAVLVPEGARLERRVLPAAMLRVSALLAAIAALMTVGLSVIPSPVGVAVLGETWPNAKPLILPIGIAVALNGTASGAFAGLRSMRSTRASLGARLRLLPLLLGLPLLGGWADAARGFAWGTTATAAAGAWVWWRTFRRQLATAPPDGGL